MIGKTLGHYAIDSELGAGGMGVVYKGRDTRLERSVAIKVVRDELLRDAGWLSRFEREARVLASLNHPNIAAIHGFEQVDATWFLVLEFVPGQTLAERLAAGPLAVKEVLGVCKEIAAAVEAAHEKGIIHRDLKPANIKVTPEGVVKVLDFGLAKAFVGDGSGPDLSQLLTVSVEGMHAGVIAGTAAYMSPEQARGKSLDKRTDIWSFGCVLYEALAGKRPFSGSTVTDVLAAILEREPDWQALPVATSSNIRSLLRRCLEKDPRRRLRDIGDARIELEEALSGQSGEAASVAAPPARRLGTAAALLVAGLGLGAGAAWLGARRTQREPVPPPTVARFEIGLPEKRIVPGGFLPQLAISPDGKQVAFAGVGGGPLQLFLRHLDDLEVRPLEGTLGGNAPVFSPDGQWLAFGHSGSRSIKKLALSGGAPVTVASGVESNFGFVWAPDGTFIYASFDLYKVPPSGGAHEILLKLDTAHGERAYREPVSLPGGRGILFTISIADTESHDDAKIGVLDHKTGRKKVLIEGGMSARYSPSGHLVYARQGALLAVPFDLDRLEVTGQPLRVLEGVLMSANTGVAQFDIGPHGTLVYAPGPAERGARRVVWVDRKGNPKPFPLPERSYLHPRLSPDERQLAIEVEGPTHDLFSYEFERGTFTKLTFDGVSHWPLWTPQGDRITFRSMRTGFFTMWWMPANRGGPEERLTEVGKWQSASSWTPDGRALALTQVDRGETVDPNVYVLSLDGERTPHPLAKSRFVEGSPKFSPDGGWVAYCSNESGRTDVYVQPWPGPGPKVQISTDGGSDPVWSRRSGELFYRNGSKMMASKVAGGPRLSAAKPRVLWEGQYSHGKSSSCGGPGPTSANYDATADGQRFVMIEDKDQEIPATRLNVVLNWNEELKRLERDRRNR